MVVIRALRRIPDNISILYIKIKAPRVFSREPNVSV